MSDGKAVKLKKKSPLGALISSQFTALFAKPKQMLHGGGREIGKLIGTVLLFTYAFGVMMVSIGGMTYLMCTIGFGELAIPMTAAMAALLMLVSGMLRGGTAVFAPRDYDFMMSLPVSQKTVVISRLFPLYLYDFFFALIIFVPSCAVYAYMNATSLAFWLLLIPSIVLLPIIPMVVGCFLGVLIAYISSRMKHKNVATIIISMAFFIGVMYLSSSSGSFFSDTEAVRSLVTALSDKIKFIYYPAVLLGAGLTGESILQWLIFAVASVLLQLLTISVLSGCLRRVHDFITSQRVGTKKKSSRGAHNNAASAPVSLERVPLKRILLKKEFKQYFSCPAYVINTIIGPLMLLLFAGVLCFAPVETIFGAEMTDAEAASILSLIKIVPAFLVFPVIMTTASASSISLEGGRRYILKSAPLAKTDIYRAKVSVNLLLLLPAVVVSWILFVIRAGALELDIFDILILLIMPASFSVFISYFGLWCNLRHQKYDWKNEIQVVKQSTAVLIVILGGMGICVIPIVASFLLYGFGALPVFGAQLGISVIALLAAYAFWRGACKIEIE